MYPTEIRPLVGMSHQAIARGEKHIARHRAETNVRRQGRGELSSVAAWDPLRDGSEGVLELKCTKQQVTASKPAQCTGPQQEGPGGLLG